MKWILRETRLKPTLDCCIYRFSALGFIISHQNPVGNVIGKYDFVLSWLGVYYKSVIPLLFQ